LLVTGQVAGVRDIRSREVLFKEIAIGLDARVVTPFGIVGIFIGGTDNDTSGILEAGRLQRSSYGAGRKIDDQRRLPADLGGPPDRLGGKLRRPATNKASAPELFKVTTCESIVGSVTS
jgi:hypothetical protein